jgi:hypothetical protein
MNGLDNKLYLVLMIMANLLAIFQLVASVKWPRIARFSFFLLFAWACIKNFTTSQVMPQMYMGYAELTWSETYRLFIHGWFATHVKLFVGTIAFFEGLIAVSMLLNHRIYEVGCIGAIIFLVSIIPLGVGSGFPATVVMSIALFNLFSKGKSKLWEPEEKLEIRNTQ